jgi:hypothetical protein
MWWLLFLNSYMVEQSFEKSHWLAMPLLKPWVSPMVLQTPLSQDRNEDSLIATLWFYWLMETVGPMFIINFGLTLEKMTYFSQ